MSGVESWKKKRIPEAQSTRRRIEYISSLLVQQTTWDWRLTAGYPLETHTRKAGFAFIEPTVQIRSKCDASSSDDPCDVEIKSSTDQSEERSSKEIGHVELSYAQVWSKQRRSFNGIWQLGIYLRNGYQIWPIKEKHSDQRELRRWDWQLKYRKLVFKEIFGQEQKIISGAWSQFEKAIILGARSQFESTSGYNGERIQRRADSRAEEDTVDSRTYTQPGSRQQPRRNCPRFERWGVFSELVSVLSQNFSVNCQCLHLFPSLLRCWNL